MRLIYEFAEYLVSAWRLSNPGERIPIDGGRLDLALSALREHLPERFGDILSFGNTRPGFRCYELSDVMHAAYQNLLVTAPTPAHRSVDVVIDDFVARMLLGRRGHCREDAKRFGERLALELAV